MDRRRRQTKAGGALLASLLLHGAAVTALALSSGAPPMEPKVKVYAVDIVSPPPNLAGEPMAQPPSNQEPGPAAPQPAAPAQPAPAEPEPPAAAPDPAPPKAEAPKEPAPAPEPRRTPPERPAQPAQGPATTNRPPAASNPPGTATPATRPQTPPTRPAGAQTGTGSGPNRTRGGGTTDAPATGRNPDAGSPGGEGLTIYSPGDPCPVAGYCDNVSRQIARYFRPPAGSSATAEVCFRLHRDGSVTDIEVQRMRRGSAAVRLSMMEAAEAAGSRRAFGTLPAAFPSGGRWCIELAPS